MEDVLVLWAARKYSKPIKWNSEDESFVTDSHARDVISDCEMVSARWKVTGLRVLPIIILGLMSLLVEVFPYVVYTFCYQTFTEFQQWK